MTWLKVDDSIYDHPKFDNVSLRAVGLWMFAGAYCARHLTDGLIGLRAVVRLGGSEQIAQELISAGLWVIDGDGYRFHDWHDHQPSRDEIHERRKASAERVRKHREQRKSKPSAPLPDDDVTRYNGVTERVTNASCNATPDPTRPDPTRPVPSEEQASQPSSDDNPTPDVAHLVAVMSESLTRLGVKHKPTTEWARTFRLMIDIDERTPAQIEGAIRWAHADDFWAANIHSPRKLRKQFDQLRIQAARPNRKSTNQQNIELVGQLADQPEGTNPWLLSPSA